MSRKFKTTAAFYLSQPCENLIDEKVCGKPSCARFKKIFICEHCMNPPLTDLDILNFAGFRSEEAESSCTNVKELRKAAKGFF